MILFYSCTKIQVIYVQPREGCCNSCYGRESSPVGDIMSGFLRGANQPRFLLDHIPFRFLTAPS
ncbi:hypothetical protein CBG53_09130 [Porphyromonas gingivalis]|nr:hypothetical protein CBG53_09130 [Porphyromonas gingivalis]